MAFSGSFRVENAHEPGGVAFTLLWLRSGAVFPAELRDRSSTDKRFDGADARRAFSWQQTDKGNRFHKRIEMAALPAAAADTALLFG